MSDVDDSMTDRVEDSLREEHLEKRPSEEKRRELLEEHRHHLVRDTTSQVTVREDPDSLITVESTVEVPDTYCFSCEEWIGLSGVDLSGTPRSKADAFYLGGAPSDVEDAREDVQDTLADLAAYAKKRVEHIETAEEALEFVGDQHALLVDAADEVVDT